MCYDISQLALKMYKEAKRLNASPEEIEYLKQRWEELSKGGNPNMYHASGFQHPEMAVFTSVNGKISMDRKTWGLIPHWVKTELQAREIWNKTLNARSESLFEKPAFRDAAANHRVIIPLDGFFEHHHKKGKTFPYFIERKDRERMLVGGIASEWTNPETGEIEETVSIVTTRGNEVMTQIHNNPTMKEARMPLILNDDGCKQWLEGNESEVKELIRPNKTIELETRTVRRLRGEEYVGNEEKVRESFVYNELYEPPTLFD